MKLFITFLVLISLYIGQPHARRLVQPQSDEQVTLNRERDLQQTPLKINHNCEPNSFLTKIYLKTLNVDQTKYFWLGQQYAVARTYKESVETRRINAISKEADAKILAIQNQRDEAIMRSAGITPLKDPEVDKVLRETDVMLSQTDQWMAKEDYKWYQKCLKYTKDRSN
jgi:hypothetical protein